jgi:phosphoribosylformylglycinamidine (FGAM) synthase PurS component
VSRYLLEIRVKPRPGLLNPQGKAIHHALNSLAWSEV